MSMMSSFELVVMRIFKIGDRFKDEDGGVSDR